METNRNESFDSNMWLISLLPNRLPGYIHNIKAGGQPIIVPLIDGLPLKDGTFVQKFFAPNGDGSRNDYVTFRWKRPGERGYDQLKQSYGDPRAVDIQVVEKDEADQLAEKIRERLSIEIRNVWQTKLNDLEQQKQKQNNLIEKLAQERTQELTHELSDKKQKIAERQAQIDAERQQLDKQQAEIESRAAIAEQAEHLWNAIKPYHAVIPLINENESSDITKPCPFPENLGQQWNELLHSSGLTLPKHVTTSYLLALFSGFYSGSLILLNGSVGVGKTSLVKYSADLLGGKSQIIPVRPAWLDSSDLLGFFDPLNETFRPSPFLTALKKARDNSDRLNLVCLDELNLAKIENYGADILSSLEYSRSSLANQGLLLYSPSIETEFWEEARLLHEQQELNSKQSQRLKRITNLLQNYSSNFLIPNNVVLLGTLNADETTYDLSPKVIDRSFVITYPLANLSIEGISEPFNPQLIAQHIAVSTLNNEIKQRVGNIMEGWDTVVEWNQQYLSKLGIPLGHRAKRDYAVFSAIANCLGLSTDECLGYFTVTKLLPRISFFKGKSIDEIPLEDLCQRWFEELDDSQNFSVSETIAHMQEQLNDDRRHNVRYWG